MTHLEIVASIEAHGGRLVASFTLDNRGETVGHETRNRAYRCSMCGQLGHSVTRCTGTDSAPRPTHSERRKLGRDWLREAAKAPTPLDEAKRILAARAAARRAK